MQRLLYSIFISFFLLLSCAKSKPSGIVSENKITEVLTEVSLVDGYLNSLPSDSAKRVMPVLYDKIFKKYKLDSLTFVKNLDFYFGNPNLTDKIYTEVNKNLSKLEREFHVEDSIQNVRYQDSIYRFDYFKRIYGKIENLRYYNASDTNYKNYYEFNRRMISNSNVDFITNYFSLSPMPNSNMLHKDSLANYMRNFKSPFIHIDTAQMHKEIDLTRYKQNGEYFLKKLGISISSGNLFQAPNPVNDGVQDMVPTDVETLPTEMDSVPTVQNEVLNPDQLRERSKMIRKDQLVNPVKRTLPQ